MVFKRFEDIKECGIGFIDRYHGKDDNALQEYYNNVLVIQLSDKVPDEVHNLFDTAKNMTLYGYFSYDMHMPAILQGCIAMERALKIYFDMDNGQTASFKTLVNRAIQERRVLNSDFKPIRHGEPLDDFADFFVQFYRNSLAHGSTMRTGSLAYEELQDICDFINGLYKGR